MKRFRPKRINMERTAPETRTKLTVFGNYDLDTMSEDQIQAMFIAWVRDNTHLLPELDLLYSVPNGSYKSVAARANFKRTGLKPGIPDICLPVASGPYHGLYIEFKTIRGELLPSQKEVIPKLKANGYFVGILFDPLDAAKVLLLYLRPLYLVTGRQLPEWQYPV